MRGPYGTRAEIVAELDGHLPGETFTIIEASKGRCDYRVFCVDSFFQALDDANYDNLDHDGDGTVIDTVTPEQERDLESMVNDAIEAWIKKHSLETEPWVFAETRNEEFYVVQPANATS